MKPRQYLLWSIVFIFFCAELAGQTIVRGPYLQSGTTSSMVVRWRTDLATDSKVWYGSSPTNLTFNITLPGSRTEHVMQINGLSTNTTYYYAVGNSTGQLTTPSSGHRFKTNPAPGSSLATNIWVLGDCGTANDNARSVRDGYYNYIGANPTDMILLLGDNAYELGSDTDYQGAVFENMYEARLINSPLYSCPGNHEMFSADSPTQSGVYYDIFTFPVAGQAGGVASGTEAYFSYDYGNIHVISMDSDDTDRSAGSPMMNWLEADLMANTKEWVIAIFHHTPYYSTSTNGADMRNNALPILESYGVDLVLVGHTHNYQRSFLINGHYGINFDSTTMAVDLGDGRLDGDGAYFKTVTGADAGKGAVYILTGSAGQVTGHPLDDPIMKVGLIELGSVSIEVLGHQMDVKFLDTNGNIDDYFTIVKQSPVGASPVVSITSPLDGAYYPAPQAITVNASASDPDGTIDFVSFSVNGQLIGTDNTFPYSQPWTIPADGIYNLTAVAWDNDGNSKASVPIQIFAGLITTCSKVNASSDDAEEDPSGAVSLISPDLELVNDAGLQTVGLRFTGLDIPKDAYITNAYIQFTADETGFDDPCILNIYGEDADNAATFTTSNGNVSTRPRTSAVINWTPPIWQNVGDAGPAQQTPNISAIIQEIVTRPGYTQNSAISIIIDGIGRRVAESSNGAATLAPEICVEYDLDPPVFDCPLLFANIGDPCDDGDPCTTNDVVQADCSCAGTFQDSDSDGTCDVLDVCPGSPEPGMPCDDGNPGTTGETVQPDCSCALYDCPVLQLDIGDPCDDGDPCTINDVVQANCNCAGTLQDSDGDGVCDADDLCPGGPEPGTPCDDGDPQTGGETIQSDCTCGGGTTGPVQTCSSIAATSDDVEQTQSGNVSLGSSDLELVLDPGTQVIGMRFLNLNIPQGAVISSASLRFTVDENSNINPCNLTIYGQDSDDPITFVNSNGNVTNRPKTTASVAWSPPDWLVVGDSGPDQTTPDLTSIIQEIVDRPGFSNASAIVLIIEGVGQRVAESFDGTAASAPRLCIVYSTVTYDCPGLQLNIGDPCDDGDPCTANDVVQADCGCAGTFQDSDSDGVCDADDLCPGGPEPGTPCDDGNPATTGEVIQPDCSCADITYDCPDLLANVGDPCDDGDPCTINDAVQIDCSCAGTFQDSDSDGTCDADDLCVGPEPGSPCNDGDPCTINDIILPDCSCAGTFQDSDSDGTCDAEDLCPGSPEPGMPCDDGNPATTGETIQSDCSCGGGIAGAVNVCVQIATGSDDAEETPGGNVSLTSSDLELVLDPSEQVIGLRFVNHNIPQGAVIASATIQFGVDETGNINPCDLTIYGQASDNPGTFVNTNGNVSTRPKTLASVAWSPPDWLTIGQAGPDQETPDLSAILQEIVNRPGYTGSSAIVFVIEGSGQRVAESFNGTASLAPQLCVQYTTITYDCPGLQLNIGDPCDDGDPCTINDTVQSDCSCLGTFQDSDSDGTCDAEDLCPGGPEPGTPCDDGNPATVGEVIQPDCTCGAVAYDCPDLLANIGDPCNDGDPCTVNDVIQSDCSCAGTFQDTDGDGTCDEEDLCPGGPEPGTPCDDTDPCTINDMVQADCSCAGTYQDSDSDGVCDAEDLCPGGPEPGTPCDDGNPNTAGETIQADCSCGGGVQGVANVCVQVTAGSDDAEESSGGNVSLTSSDLELVVDGNTQVIGLRFLNHNIPPGAIVVDARLQFTVDETGNVDPCNLVISGQAADNPSTFVNSNANVSSRPRTLATVNWSPPLWQSVGASGPDQQTPDISAILQEIINRPGYSSTSAIVLIVEGVGQRVAESFDGSVSGAPELCVQYTTVPFDCPAQQKNIGDPCDDGDLCTINDVIQPDCGCAGVFQDSDSDGVCDAEDLCPGGPEPGTPCDDGNPATTGEVIQPDCSCADVSYDCPDLLANIGDPCNDGDLCTVNDVIQPDCSCAGTFQDTDGDGTCDADDLCSDSPEPGSPCDDGDPCTVNDVVLADCSCVGTFQDSDGDGVCDADDLCFGPEPGSPCDDGNPNTAGETIQPDCSCGGGVTGAASTCVRVGSTTDDAEERASGAMSLNSSDLELIFDANDQTVGMRFVGLNIPQGATIVSATLQFTVDEAANINPCILMIYGEADDNPVAFTQSNGNITSRLRTTASIDWSPPDWLVVGEAGPSQMTPDLTSILQEIVDRPGFTTGSAVVLILDGVGQRVAESFDGSSESGPELCVSYEAPMGARADNPDLPVNLQREKSADEPQVVQSVGPLSVHPNPARDRLTVTFSSEKDAAALSEIRNVGGQKVFGEQWQVQKGANSILLEGLDLPSGIYFLRVWTEDSLQTTKFTINR